jgi:FkbM family methyltransferase
MLISYSQNFEDIMLWRALKHVKQGFYIDAGAASPSEDSVTRLFYDNGWHGINIDPNSDFHRQLKEHRPRDVNLQIGLSDREATAVLHEIVETGLSTFLSDVAEEHAARGYKAVLKEVRITTLSAVWSEWAPADVHFLKVDVEGFETPLLKGNDWQKNRPWIVVVESTRPMTQIECYQEWEPILLGADYRFVYFDGLNRFYVAAEHFELEAGFCCPPNVFDRFKTIALVQAEEGVKQLEAEVARCRNEVDALRNQINDSFVVRKPKIMRSSRRVQKSGS